MRLAQSRRLIRATEMAVDAGVAAAGDADRLRSWMLGLARLSNTSYAEQAEV